MPTVASCALRRAPWAGKSGVLPAGTALVPVGVGFGVVALVAALVDLGRTVDPRRLELSRAHD